MTRPLFVVVGVVASMLVAAGAQLPPPVPLTGADYVEIETAYGRSLHDDGSRRGVRLWLTNLAIDPSRTGAVAWAYVVEARGLEFLNGALYQDHWEETSGEWRLQRRAVHPGNAMPPREHYPAPSNVGARAFTPRDYFEIKHVVWRYNLAYDNAAPHDGGVLSSLWFTPDALFERPGFGDSKGRDQMVTFAKERQKVGGTHHWDTNLWLDPGPAGVNAFSYLLTFNVPDAGHPVRIGGANPLVHRFVRTAEGWLIEHRRLETLSVKPNVTWPATEFGLSEADVAREAGAGRERRDRLSAIDHVEIEQLYTRTAIAFDSAREQGAAFARSFTADGVMSRGGVTTRGASGLAALAAHRKPTIETWLSNLFVERTKGGARGRVYVAMKGAGATDPVTDVGTFEDELVKTREGWRFVKRTYASQIAHSR